MLHEHSSSSSMVHHAIPQDPRHRIWLTDNKLWRDQGTTRTLSNVPRFSRQLKRNFCSTRISHEVTILGNVDIANAIRCILNQLNTETQ